MIQFTVKAINSTIAITLDTDDPDDEVVPTYVETMDEDGVLPSLLFLKDYITDRGGMLNSIDPDYCSARDLHHALTTPYNLEGTTPFRSVPYSQMEFELETDFNPPPLPELPEGCMY